ncbi:unnamed protein product, partial [Ixodes pacificus]
AWGSCAHWDNRGHPRSGRALTAPEHLTGPSFSVEPPTRVTFYNSTGALVPCTAVGQPRPDVHWVRAATGHPVRDVPGVLAARYDGTLVFSPFRAQDYRQDVHAATYRCLASNSAGSVGSRDVHVRASESNSFDLVSARLVDIIGKRIRFQL